MEDLEDRVAQWRTSSRLPVSTLALNHVKLPSLSYTIILLLNHPGCSSEDLVYY